MLKKLRYTITYEDATRRHSSTTVADLSSITNVFSDRSSKLSLALSFFLNSRMKKKFSWASLREEKQKALEIITYQTDNIGQHHKCILYIIWRSRYQYCGTRVTRLTPKKDFFSQKFKLENHYQHMQVDSDSIR